MAYIQPDSTILICKDIPLNASYDDTLTFYDSNGNWDYTAQYNYFASKTSAILKMPSLFTSPEIFKILSSV